MLLKYLLGGTSKNDCIHLEWQQIFQDGGPRSCHWKFINFSIFWSVLSNGIFNWLGLEAGVAKPLPLGKNMLAKTFHVPLELF